MSNKLEDSLREIKALGVLCGADSPLGRMSASIKIPMTFAYILAVVSFPRYDISGVIVFAAYPAIALALMDVSKKIFFRRALLALPFVFFIGLGNLFFDTSFLAGLTSFATLAAKAFLCVLAVLILTATTPANSMIQALRGFGVPCVIILQLMLTVRYLEVLVSEAINIKNAYFLRAPNCRMIPLCDWSKLAGNLLLRSFDRAERIYSAMLCRGFDARKMGVEPLKKTPLGQYLFLIVFIFICVFLRYFNVSEFFGKLFLK